MHRTEVTKAGYKTYMKWEAPGSEMLLLEVSLGDLLILR